MGSEFLSDLPPPAPDSEASSHPHDDPVEKPSDPSSTQRAARADRIARIGFWCSVGAPAAFLLALDAKVLFLLGTSGVMLLMGLGLSIAGAASPGTSPGPRKLAVAGIVIAVCIIGVSPALLWYAAWNWAACC